MAITLRKRKNANNSSFNIHTKIKDIALACAKASDFHNISRRQIAKEEIESEKERRRRGAVKWVKLHEYGFYGVVLKTDEPNK